MKSTKHFWFWGVLQGLCVCVLSVGDINEFQPGLLNFLCTWTNHAHLGVHTYPLRGFPRLMTWLPPASDSDLM